MAKNDCLWPLAISNVGHLHDPEDRGVICRDCGNELLRLLAQHDPVAFRHLTQQLDVQATMLGAAMGASGDGALRAGRMLLEASIRANVRANRGRQPHA